MTFVEREVLPDLARCRLLLYLTTFQSKSNDGGHVTSKVTMPMMASVDTGMFSDELLRSPLQIVQLWVNGDSCNTRLNRSKDGPWTGPHSGGWSDFPSTKEEHTCSKGHVTSARKGE
jgi:hypothetical protein